MKDEVGCPGAEQWPRRLLHPITVERSKIGSTDVNDALEVICERPQPGICFALLVPAPFQQLTSLQR